LPSRCLEPRHSISSWKRRLAKQEALWQDYRTRGSWHIISCLRSNCVPLETPVNVFNQAKGEAALTEMGDKSGVPSLASAENDGLFVFLVPMP
jgi:hypothetical protein